jgi:AGCS family alanine or glycine:cation symporter
LIVSLKGGIFVDLQGIVNFLNSLIWSNFLVGYCLLAGLAFTVATKFVQIRKMKEMVTLLMNGNSSDSGVSSFQSFAMALGGRVGTGNIAGVATAIGYGGPGAIFWMWVIAFLGAGSAYIEASLAQVYKDEIDGQYRGGPSYYIEKGLGMKKFGTVFAVVTLLACGVFMPGVQSNAIASSMQQGFGISPTITGLVVAGLLGAIIMGGVKRIGKVAEVVVPVMAIIYIALALIIIVLNAGQIIPTFKLIITSAFGQNAAFGGILGSTIMWGVKRGIYSNEAGQGTGPQAAAAAEVSHPAKQGLVQAFSVYVDTLFICTATALMILITKSYNVIGPAGNLLAEHVPGLEAGPAFTQHAVNTLIPGFGPKFVAVALFFFAFTSLLAFYYYAESNVAYLFRNSNNSHIGYNITRVCLVVTTYYGAVRTANLAWGLGDIGVGLMAWLNLIAITLLAKIGLATLRDYEKQQAEGKDPVFNPDDIGVKNAELWYKIADTYKAEDSSDSENVS